jgi:hypothetical protein
MTTRRHTRRHLDSLFADIKPSQRRQLFALAYKCVAKTLVANAADVGHDGKPISARNRAETFNAAMRGLETLGALSERAGKHEDSQRKLLEAVMSADTAAKAAPVIHVHEAPIDDGHTDPPEPPPDKGSSGS